MTKKYVLLIGVNRYDFDTQEQAEAFYESWRSQGNVALPASELLEVSRVVKTWPPKFAK